MAGREDADLFESAALTVELRPPGPKDTAQNLRAAALLGLAELDSDRAVLYAMRLLDDPHTSGVTNQPALTALNVLAFADRMDAVYLQLLRGGRRSEVTAECLRAVISLPVPLATELVRGVFKGSDETAMLGAIDLCLSHTRSAQLLPVLRAFLRETELIDVYGYAATAVVASRGEEALEMLREERPLTADPRKRQLLDRALELS